MLEAVSNMLDKGQGTFEIIAYHSKIDCAKIMLDKIIESLKKDPNALEQELKITPPKRKSTQNNDQVAIVPNDDGSIKDIIGMDDDGKIELDGKVYTKKEAIGRKFQHGRVL